MPIMASKAEFVDQTGRLLHPSKRGVIGVHELPALRKLGLDMRHWTMQVNGIGSGYWRAVGTAEELIEKAAEIGQNCCCFPHCNRTMGAFSAYLRSNAAAW